MGNCAGKIARSTRPELGAGNSYRTLSTPKQFGRTNLICEPRLIVEVAAHVQSTARYGAPGPEEGVGRTNAVVDDSEAGPGTDSGADEAAPRSVVLVSAPA